MLRAITGAADVDSAVFHNTFQPMTAPDGLRARSAAFGVFVVFRVLGLGAKAASERRLAPWNVGDLL